MVPPQLPLYGRTSSDWGWKTALQWHLENRQPWTSIPPIRHFDPLQSTFFSLKYFEATLFKCSYVCVSEASGTPGRLLFGLKYSSGRGPGQMRPEGELCLWKPVEKTGAGKSKEIVLEKEMMAVWEMASKGLVQPEQEGSRGTQVLPPFKLYYLPPGRTHCLLLEWFPNEGPKPIIRTTGLHVNTNLVH